MCRTCLVSHGHAFYFGILPTIPRSTEVIYPLQASLKTKIGSGINPTENYRPYDRLFSFQQAINPSPKRKSRSMTVLPVLKQMPGLYIRRETSSIFALLLGVYSGRQNGLPPRLGDKNKLCNCMQGTLKSAVKK